MYLKKLMSKMEYEELLKRRNKELADLEDIQDKHNNKFSRDLIDTLLRWKREH